MTPEQLRSLAEMIVNQMGLASWAWALITIICSAIGGYFGAYLKKRAENRAIKDDFTEIKQRLQETTQATEEIKRSVTDRGWLAQQRWGRRESHYVAVLSALLRYEKACNALALLVDKGSVDVEIGKPVIDEFVAASNSMSDAYGVAVMLLDEDHLPNLTKFMESSDRAAAYRIASNAQMLRLGAGAAKLARHDVVARAQAKLRELEG